MPRFQWTRGREFSSFLHSSLLGDLVPCPLPRGALTSPPGCLRGPGRGGTLHTELKPRWPGLGAPREGSGPPPSRSRVEFSSATGCVALGQRVASLRLSFLAYNIQVMTPAPCHHRRDEMPGPEQTLQHPPPLLFLPRLNSPQMSALCEWGHCQSPGSLIHCPQALYHESLRPQRIRPKVGEKAFP